MARFARWLAAVGLSIASSCWASPYQVGDVFASIGDGQVNVYSSTGVFKQTLNTGLGGFTTGSAFDSSGNFYVTAFSAGKISQFDPNGALQNANFATGATFNAPESIVFDASGNFYVGNAGAARIDKFNASGAFLQSFATQQNTDWIDLAADQKTLIYSNEGSVIRKLDTSTLVDTVFATGVGVATYAKRITASGDVLMANSTGNVYRYDAAGVLQQTYAIGIGSVFALNLDPDGTSFWTGATGGTAVRKVDIASGAILSSFNVTGQLFGLSVFGEITAGNPNDTPEPGSLALAALALVAAGTQAWSRRSRRSPASAVQAA